jgi:hypothetical protein
MAGRVAWGFAVVDALLGSSARKHEPIKLVTDVAEVSVEPVEHCVDELRTSIGDVVCGIEQHVFLVSG